MRVRTVVFAVLVVTCVALMMVAPAIAAAVTWSSYNPTPNSTISSFSQTIRVTATAGSTEPDLVRATAKLWINGNLYAVTTTQPNSKTVTFTATNGVLPDGVQTISVQITDAVGTVFNHSWNYTIQSPPTLSQYSPPAQIPAITTSDPRQPIKVTTWDNTSGNIYVYMAVDGVPVINGMRPQGVTQYTPTSDWSTGGHTVTGYVRDAAGNQTNFSPLWGFSVYAPQPMDPELACGSCHPTHPEPPDCGACHEPYSGTFADHDLTCLTCHSTTYPAAPAPHSDAAYDAIHASVNSCGPCHGNELVAEHAQYPSGTAFKYQCGICHESTNPTIVTAIAAGDTNCTACHVSTDHTTVHEVAHDCGGGGCHSATNLTDIHAAPGCLGCHSSTNPDVVDAIATNNTNCEACHNIANHTAVPHVSSETCNACHNVSDLVTVHGRDCAKCHPLAEGVRPWNGTCAQAGCHATRHADMASYYHQRDEMATYYGEDCWACHQEPSSEWNCQQCHLVAPDNTAPVTTSNARVSYAGGAAIALSATDPGTNPSGVRKTYYRVDGGAVTEGASVSVVAPLNGSSLHTLEFWSSDKALNTEAPKSVTFTVEPVESIAPVTTSDAKSSYVGPATIRLTATDTGGSGVAATYYKVDGGTQQTGTTISLASIGNHTIEFWSVDHSGNVETHKTASFTISAGTGTIRFAWDSPPEGSWVIVSVRKADGTLVYQNSSPNWNPAGWFTVTVPVNSSAYKLRAQWYDASSDEEDVSNGTALIDTPGKSSTFWY